MRKSASLLQILVFLCCSLLLAQCTTSVEKQKAPVAETTAEEGAEEETEGEDGIREAQEMDFEMTRDLRLGYVPMFRLVSAYNTIAAERKAGRYARISSLSWVERGPNNNVVGPTNGNTRGPGNNAVVSGRMRAIHVDLNDNTNRTVWAASVSGGLWKTTNITASPANWVLVNDFFGNLAITSIAQDPVNRNVLYFGTGERNNNIDAVRGGGIWKSTDGGATWNLLPNTTQFWNVAKILCDAAGNLYVGTNGNNRGLQRTTDGGVTWTNITPTVPNGSNRVTDLKLSNNGRLHITMAGTNAEGSYFTDNPATVTSATWTAPLVPIPNLNANCEIAVVGNVLYALPEDGATARTPQIYKSTDGGVSWSATPTSPPGGSTEPTINQGQGWFNLAIGIDPNNTDIVIAGGLNFYRTNDGGATWSQITRWVGTTLNYVHADHHGVFWNGTQVLVATDGGIFYSNNNGQSFADRNVGMRTLQFYSCALHPTLNYYLGGTQDNGSHSLTATSGITGSIEVHGGDGGFTHIDEDQPQFQFSATTRSDYRRSVDGGISWVRPIASGIGQFINPTDYDDINNRMYCSGSSGSYARWDNAPTDNVLTTVSISTVTTSTIRSLKVSPFTPNRVFMGTAAGTVLRIDNAHLNAPSPANITGANMPAQTGAVVSSVNTGTSDNALIATYSNFGLPHVWVSTNGGGSWTNVNGNLPDVPVRWAMFYPDDDTKAIIATDMGVFETSAFNGASTVWVQNGTFANVRTNMFQYRSNDRTILAATHGRGFWTTRVPATQPYVRFASSYNYSTLNTETQDAVTGCRSYRDFTINMSIDAAPAGNATVTLETTGSAVAGVDFDITTNGNFTNPSRQLVFNSGSTSTQPVTIRVYDDGEVEAEESFTITYTISGSTNAAAAPGSQQYTVRIADNDVVPASFANTIETGFGAFQSLEVRNNAAHYFYTTGSSRILAQVANAASPLGCYTVTLDGVGATWQTFLNGSRSAKVFQVTTNGTTGISHQVGFYVTADELAGRSASTLLVTGTTATSLATAGTGNTFTYPTVVTPYGSDFLFTATVPSFTTVRFFLTEGVTTSVFDRVRNTGSFAKLLQNPVTNQVPLLITNDNRKKLAASLFAVNGMMIRQWDLGTANGNYMLNLQDVLVVPGTYLLRISSGTEAQTIQLLKN